MLIEINVFLNILIYLNILVLENIKIISKMDSEVEIFEFKLWFE